MEEVEIEVGTVLVAIDVQDTEGLYVDVGIVVGQEYVVASVDDRYLTLEGVQGSYTVQPDSNGDSWKTFYTIKE